MDPTPYPKTFKQFLLDCVSQKKRMFIRITKYKWFFLRSAPFISNLKKIYYIDQSISVLNSNLYYLIEVLIARWVNFSMRMENKAVTLMTRLFDIFHITIKTEWKEIHGLLYFHSVFVVCLCLLSVCDQVISAFYFSSTGFPVCEVFLTNTKYALPLSHSYMREI